MQSPDIASDLGLPPSFFGRSLLPADPCSSQRLSTDSAGYEDALFTIARKLIVPTPMLEPMTSLRREDFRRCHRLRKALLEAALAQRRRYKATVDPSDFARIRSLSHLLYARMSACRAADSQGDSCSGEGRGMSLRSSPRTEERGSGCE